MGIFSDNFEELRERGLDEGYGYYIPKPEYKPYCNIFSRGEPEYIHRTMKNYQKEYEEYETIRTYCDVYEKQVCFINNRGLESIVFKDIISVISDIINDSREDATKKIESLIIKKRITIKNIRIEKDACNELLLDTIMCNVYKALLSDVISNKVEFKKVIYDSAKAITALSTTENCVNKQQITQQYLTARFNIQSSDCKCSNCGEYKFDGISYCLNCFER